MNKAERNTVNTLHDLTELLSQGLSEETLTGWTRYQAFTDARGGPAVPREHLSSPRAQLRQLLVNIATAEKADWNGPVVAKALIAVLNGGNLRETCNDAGLSIPSLMTLPMMAMTFKRLADNEFGSIQPQLLDDWNLIFFLQAVSVSEGKGLIQLQLASTPTSFKRDTLHTAFSVQELDDLAHYGPRGLTVISELCGSISREIALERNHQLLRSLWEANARIGVPESVMSMGDIYAINNRIFTNAFGDMSHLILSPDMEMLLLKTLPRDVAEFRPRPLPVDTYSGFSPSSLYFHQMPNLKVYRTPFWMGKKALGLYRGEHWAATPVVWSPLLLTSTETTEPMFAPDGQSRTIQTLTAGFEVVNKDWVQGLEITD
jgi:hypothetical protein